MATEVFSVKVSDELKAKIQALIAESGLPGQGFMEQIVHIYELNTAKNLMPSSSGDVAELQALTRRISDIFVHLIEQNINFMADKERSHNQELEEKDKTIALIQANLDAALIEVGRLKGDNQVLLNQYLESQDGMAQTETRIQEQERSHRDLLDSKEALIKEYRSKNDALTGVVSEYQEYKDRNKELLTSVETFKAEMELLKKHLREKERSEESLRSEMERMRSQQEVSLLKTQMEQDRAILALREQHQSRIEELSRKYNDEIARYNQQVRDLLEQIESIRAGKSVQTDAE